MRQWDVDKRLNTKRSKGQRDDKIYFNIYIFYYKITGQEDEITYSIGSTTGVKLHSLSLDFTATIY